MNRELKLALLNTRIELLMSRAGKDNGRIIRKLMRERRKYEKQ